VRITPIGLTRVAGAAAVAAGVIFVGVQVNHPHLDAGTIATTEMAIRGALKVAMAGLALAGLTGMYLRQVREAGVPGLVGYLLFAVGYLLMLGTAFASAFVLPAIAGTDPAYVDDVIAVATGGTPDGHVGLLATVIHLQTAAYLAGGLVFGIALYRARVLARWAAALLAVSGPIVAALSVMPDALYRFLAWPNGIAMVALGCSLWRHAHPGAPVPHATDTPRPATAGVG
jgi:hypothetical protein